MVCRSFCFSLKNVAKAPTEGITDSKQLQTYITTGQCRMPVSAEMPIFRRSAAMEATAQASDTPSNYLLFKGKEAAAR